MFGVILYVVLFLFTIVIEVSIIRKSKGKALFWIFIYAILCILGILLGNVLASEIANINDDYLTISSNKKIMTIHGFVFVPLSVLIYIYLYKMKKINSIIATILILITLLITIGAFFLLLIN